MLRPDHDGFGFGGGEVGVVGRGAARLPLPFIGTDAFSMT